MPKTDAIGDDCRSENGIAELLFPHFSTIPHFISDDPELAASARSSKLICKIWQCYAVAGEILTKKGHLI
jgi:hypothetical protein